MLPALKEQIKLFFLSPIFLSGIFSWLGAQFIKTFISLIYGKVKSFHELMELLIWRTGGMPSSHSALIVSTCTTIGFKYGLNSDFFQFSLIFLLVVIRDALGVRRSSGMQAQKLNQLGKELAEKGLIDEYEPCKEVHGHTPLQVMFGCLLGLLVGCAFSLLK